MICYLVVFHIFVEVRRFFDLTSRPGRAKLCLSHEDLFLLDLLTNTLDSLQLSLTSEHEERIKGELGRLTVSSRSIVSTRDSSNSISFRCPCSCLFRCLTDSALGADAFNSSMLAIYSSLVVDLVL